MMISALALTACGKAEETKKTEATTEATAETTTEQATTEQATTEQATTEKQEAEGDTVEVETSESNTVTSQSNDIYVGEFFDYDYNEPELKINANGDGTYNVHIGIIRLAVFEDAAAIVTDAGLEFIAEDGAGNPIKGVITLEGNDAVVTFTESTWSLITNGTAYRYYRQENQ